MELERDYLRKARRKNRETRGYFDDDDDDESFSRTESDSTSLGESNDVPAASNGPAQDEIDPLDAFMAGISAQVKQEQSTVKRPAAKPTRIFADDDDVYMEGHARAKPRCTTSSSGGINTREFADSDEEVYATAKRVDGEEEDDEDDPKKKAIEVLAPLNHCAIEYETFRKQFYTPHAAIAALTDAEAKDLVEELAVTSDGRDVPRPIQSFVQVGFDRKMLAMLMKLGLEAPTPIQAQAFPIALSGRDLIGIAKTGSGKTLAFTLPMVVHVMDQRKLRHGEGPIAIVLSPTRELAHQIFGQAKKFLNVYGAQCAAVYGGVGKWDQIQVLRKGAEVVVATPGRLIDMIRKKNVPTKRVTFVVLDEADRMFEMGFEPQLRSIMGQIRPDRQTLMFSATFRKRVEHLARDVLQDPIKITVGQIGQANEEIHQIAVVLANHKAKWPWLMANLKRIVADGRVLIFAASKTGCEEMAKNLHALGYPCNCLHGDKTQQERNEALANFRTGASPILVATDVASRGLDVKEVKTVINYDVAKNIDTHVHRIGRTGRMGAEGFEPGTAYTLVTNHDSQFAAQLVYNMDVSGQAVAADLLALAKRDPRFRRGAPGNGGGFSASASPSAGGSSHLTLHGKDRALDGDDEDDVLEMKRWNESQKTTKAERRKGLGFAADVGGSSGGIRMAFVKASSATTSSCPLPFQTGFAQASHTPAPPHRPMVQPSRSPPVPVQAPPPPPLGLISSPAFRPPPLPPALVQAARLPPHVGQLESRMKSTDGDGTVPVGLQAPSSSLHIAQSSDTQPSVINDASLSPQEQRGRNDSRERDRSSRSRHRSRSSSRSRSRGQRYDRRSRSHSRGRRRYRSRSPSPSRSRSRRRSRSSDRYARNARRSRSQSRGRRRH